MCSGQVLPAPTENCSSPFDDNCNGTINEGCGLCARGTTAPCYSGPVSTQGVGRCRAGTRTCNNFGFYGVCTGQVTPTTETCNTPDDENCDGSTECNDVHVWSKRFGDAACQEGLGVAADAAGNVVISGVFQGTVNFGGAPFTSAGGNDAFVAMLDSNGNHVWSHQLGNTSYSISLDVATDGAGNTLVSGVFDGTLRFDGTAILTSSGSTDSFVLKLSPGGTLLQSAVIGGPAQQEVWAMAVDTQGDVLVAGRNWGRLLIPAIGVDEPTRGSADAFVVKLSGSTLSPRWARYWGAGGFDGVQAVATDTHDNILVTGRFSNTVNFGVGSPRMSLGGEDAFVAKLNPVDGSSSWVKVFGGAGTQAAADVKTDGADNVVVTGGFENSGISFDGPLLSSVGDWDIFLVKLDTLFGDNIWSKRFGGTSTDVAEGLAVADDGSIAITGGIVGTTDLGGGTRTGAGGYDSFVARFNADGSHRWSQVHGDVTDQYGFAATFDNAGNIVVIGDLEGRTRFGQDAPAELVSNGCQDIFLLKVRAVP
jgi:hypothetical protein